MHRVCVLVALLAVTGCGDDETTASSTSGSGGSSAGGGGSGGSGVTTGTGGASGAGGAGGGEACSIDGPLTGAPQSAITFDGAGDELDAKVAADADGNHYFAFRFDGPLTFEGTLYTPTGIDAIIGKRTPSGDVAWVVHVISDGSPTIVLDLAVGPDGAPTVLARHALASIPQLGLPVAPSFYGCLVVKLDPQTGAPLADALRIEGLCGGGGANASLAVDAEGRVGALVVAQGDLVVDGNTIVSDHPDNYDSALVVLDEGLGFLWGSIFGNDGGEQPGSLGVDSMGRWYATAIALSGALPLSLTFGGQTITNTEASTQFNYVVRFDADGTPGPARTIQAENSGYAQLAMGSDGPVVTMQVGSSVPFELSDEPTAAGGALAVIRMDHDLEILGAWLASGLGSHRPSDITVDADDHAIVAGTFSGVLDIGDGTPRTGQDNDAFLLKLDPAGTPVWLTQQGEASGQFLQAIATSCDGTVFGAGTFYGSITLPGGTETAEGGGVYFETFAP